MSERDDRLRKLEPKLGKKTSRALWLASRDAKLRRHVDPFISALSDSLLGRHYREEQILLPPPSLPESAGSIDVGDVWYDEKRGRLGLRPEEVVRHVGILGASGSGKTTAAFRLVRSLLESGYPVIVFDVKRTWRSLLEYLPESKVRVYTLSRPSVSPFQFNFMIPPAGVPAELYDQIATRIGDEVLYGGLGSQSIVKAAVERLRRLYPMPQAADDHFTMADVLREVQRLSGELRMQKRAGDWSATALRIVGELCSPPLGRVINLRRNVFEEEVDSAGLVVFEMDLMTQPQYTFLVTSFLVREYFRRLATDCPDELKKVIVFEEAARIFNQPYPQPQFDTILREIREKGVGIVWLSQAASEVNATAWANTSTLLVFKQNSTRDINAVGSAVAFERPREKAYVARLGVGEAIVRLPDRYRFPFLVKTQNIPKIVVSDERIHALAMARLKHLGISPLDREPDSIPVSQGDKRSIRESGEENVSVDAPPAVAGEPVIRFASKQEEYQIAMVHLLTEVSRSPDKPVTHIYSRLGLSKAKGHKIKGKLVAEKLVEEDRVAGLGGVQVRLRPSAKAAGWLGQRAHLLDRPLVAWKTNRFGGPKSQELKEAAVAWATGELGAQKVGEEADDGFGGRWDLLCETPAGQVVVELVTGESKAHEAIHVQKAVSRGLPIVLVCWNDVIRNRIRRYLGEQGFAESDRLRLMTLEEVREAQLPGRASG